MKKMLLLSLMTALSIATFSATTQVTAQLNVIDPESEISLNLSSTSAAFGDVLITNGEVSLGAPITFTLEGTAAKNAHISAPETVDLTSGSNKITLATELSGSSFATHTYGGHTILRSNETLNNVSGGRLEGALSAKLNLQGTELPGRYTGTIALNAFYN